MDLMLLTGLGAICALVFAVVAAAGILKKKPGTKKMEEISKHIQEGAMAYLMQQYKVVGIFFAILFLILFFISWIIPILTGGEEWL